MDFVGICALVVIVTAILCTLRHWFNGGRCRSNIRLDGKTVIITGGNAGVGKATAVDLAKRGALVVIACRDSKRGAVAVKDIRWRSGSSNVHLKILDLSSLESIREFSQSVLAEYDRIDILINNAGVSLCPYTKTADGFEMQIGVNHFGHFALTNLLLQRISESAPSRIVTVSSIAHTAGKIAFDDINSRRSYNSTSAYAQSKLANILFSKELSRKLATATATAGVTAYVVHPGYVITEIVRHVGILASFANLAVGWLVGKSPEQGAQTSVYCAVEEGIEKQSGSYFSDCAVKESSKASCDDAVAKKLWELSESMTNIKYPL